MTHLVPKDRHWYVLYLIWDCKKRPLHLVIFCAHPSNKKQYILLFRGSQFPQIHSTRLFRDLNYTEIIVVRVRSA